MNKLVYLLILFPVVVYAQGSQGMPPHMQMDQQKMQQMQRNLQQMDMGRMQEAMTCMQSIDPAALQGLDEESKKIQAELSGLCQSGKRSEAQDKAIAYGKEMMARPEMKKMRECSKMVRGMMPKMPFENIEELSKDKHVCDDFGK